MFLAASGRLHRHLQLAVALGAGGDRGHGPGRRPPPPRRWRSPATATTRAEVVVRHRARRADRARGRRGPGRPAHGHAERAASPARPTTTGVRAHGPTGRTAESRVGDASPPPLVDRVAPADLQGHRAAPARPHGRGPLAHRRERRRDAARRPAAGRARRAVRRRGATTSTRRRRDPAATRTRRTTTGCAASTRQGNATVWPAPADPPATFVSAATGVADLTAPQFRTNQGRARHVRPAGRPRRGLPRARRRRGVRHTRRCHRAGRRRRRRRAARSACRRGNLVLDGRSRHEDQGRIQPGHSLVFRRHVRRLGRAVGRPGRRQGQRNAKTARFRPERRDPARRTRRRRAGRIPLPARLIGTAHVYRIEWTGTGFAFSVDGQPVGTLPAVGGADAAAGQRRRGGRHPAGRGLDAAARRGRRAGTGCRGSWTPSSSSHGTG